MVHKESSWTETQKDGVEFHPSAGQKSAPGGVNASRRNGIDFFITALETSTPK